MNRIKVVEIVIAIVAATVATAKSIIKLIEHFNKRKTGPSSASA